MTDSRTIRVIQTVHVSHNRTVASSWYDVVERTIERTMDAEGNIMEDVIVGEEVIEQDMDLEEDVIARDEDTEDDEIVEENFEDEAE